MAVDEYRYRKLFSISYQEYHYTPIENVWLMIAVDNAVKELEAKKKDDATPSIMPTNSPPDGI